jgi:hypothetical protein
MKKLFTATLLFASIIANAQLLDWEDAPKLHTITNKEWLEKSAIIIVEDIQKEFKLDETKKDVEILYSFHKIVKVNDEKGIEIYNKGQIAFSKIYNIIDLKARTITADGKVIVLKPSAFKDQQDEDGGWSRIFAFEGVEKGAELEYVYSCKLPANFYGSYNMQDQFPTLSSKFEIISLEVMKFEIRKYGEIVLTKDSLYEDKRRHISAQVNNLPGIEEEEMAAYKAQFARIEYKFAYNLNSPGVRLNTWNTAAKKIYENHYTYEDKEKKAIKDFVDNKELNACTSNEQKVIWLENYIKKTFFVKENIQEDNAYMINYILKNKVTSEFGIKRLYCCALQELGIKFDIGYTTNRFKKMFDYSWDNIGNLENFLIYLPETKKYLAPLEYAYRYPLFPASWGLNDGMFIKVVKLGEYSNALPEKRYIDLAPYTNNCHNHVVTMAFNKSMDTINVDLEMDFKGINAIGVLPAFALLEDKEKKLEIAKDMLKLMQKDDKITDVTWENAEMQTLSTDKYFKLKGIIHSTSIIEKAGPKYLISVGSIIGRQSELYENKKRQFDADMDEPHQLLRSIKFKIPAGFKISNLDAAKLNFVCKEGETILCKFISDGKMEGDEYVITIEETYNTPIVKLANFESFRKVINAAADFNKVVLVVVKN